nr:hypothetical protein Iba_chr02bCG8250 [Ipomoea batatas]
MPHATVHTNEEEEAASLPVTAPLPLNQSAPSSREEKREGRHCCRRKVPAGTSSAVHATAEEITERMKGRKAAAALPLLRAGEKRTTRSRRSCKGSVEGFLPDVLEHGDALTAESHRRRTEELLRRCCGALPQPPPRLVAAMPETENAKLPPGLA